MSSRHAPSESDALPTDWAAESYPSVDTEWLAASYISQPLAVGLAVLIADVTTEDGGQVYPIAITQDINAPVTSRTYEILDVESTEDDARAFAHEAMAEVLTALDEDAVSFVKDATEVLTADTVCVGTPAPEIATDLCGTRDHYGDGIRCAECQSSIVAQFPMFATAVRREGAWSLDTYYCEACRPTRETIETDVPSGGERALVVLSIAACTRRLIRISGVQVLCHSVNPETNRG